MSRATPRKTFLLSNIVLPVCLGLYLCASPALATDRCADARDDIHRAQSVAESGRPNEAKTLLRSALFACPANPQNLELLAEAYDGLGELAQAATYREQAMRLRGVQSKPTVEFTADRLTVERGQTAQLSWNTTNASVVEITPDLGRSPARGGKTVAPTANVTYRLTARGPGGTAAAALDIAVITPRLTESQLLDLLKNEVPQPRITQLVGERGIAFQVTSSVEDRLRAAGAGDILIQALKKVKP